MHGHYILNMIPTYLSADGPPPDGTPNVLIQSFKKGLVALFYILAIVGIIFSITCLLFNTVFRNRRLECAHSHRVWST